MRLWPIAIPAVMMAAATPFWDTKPAADWTLDEVQAILTGSPWAQMASAGQSDVAPPVQIYVASAQPAILAEDRMRVARRKPTTDPAWEDYRAYLVENTGKYIILAIAALKPEVFLDNSETTQMEKESRMKIGKRKYKIEGHFPPSSTDPYVRLVFPRDVREGDRFLEFEVYAPGSGNPYRQVRFELKDMTYHGKPAY